MEYAQIVFMQGQEANYPIGLIRDYGPKEALNYLKQWDQGEYHDVRDSDASGRNDKRKEFDNYILTWNCNLEYIGLQLVIND